MFAFFDTVIAFFNQLASFVGTIVSSLLHAITLVAGSLSFGYSIVGAFVSAVILFPVNSFISAVPLFTPSVIFPPV